MQRRVCWCLQCVLLIAGISFSVLSEEPVDPRSRLACCQLEIIGIAQGGQVGVGFTRSQEPPLTVTTNTGETANQVAGRLFEALKAKDEGLVDITDGGRTLRIYNVGNGDVYFKSTDPGIRSGDSIEDLRAESDPAKSIAVLSWRLPDSRPDAIYVFNSAGEAVSVAKDANQYSYAYPESKGWGCWFYVVCGYFSADGDLITRYSDLRQVWVDNPHEMTSKDLKIVVDPNSLPFPLDREDACSLTKLGGTNPCAWSIVQGTLPPGLTMDANGRISGKATQLGLRTITVKLRDARGAETEAAVGVEVFDIPLYKKPKE